MTRYFRVSVGKNAKFLDYAIANNCIGTDWMVDVDLSGKFGDDWRDFNKEFIPVVRVSDSIDSSIAAGLACGMTWTVARDIDNGDVVLVPTGQGTYRSAKVVGPYEYAPGEPLAHRRAVQWLPQVIDREAVSEPLRRSLSSSGTVVKLESYSKEIDALFGPVTPAIVVADPDVENPLTFVLEKHLEDFLVANWPHTALGETHDLVIDEDGESVGRQYPTDTGPIDILAQSKDGSELLVVELKRGRVSDVVVGQVLRYMGYIAETAPEKKVSGVIVGLEDDPRFRRALSMVPDVRFMRYEVKFRLIDA